MARRKQQGTQRGAGSKADRSYSLEDALSATQQHTVPVLPAENATPTHMTLAQATARTRVTLAPYPATAHPAPAAAAAATSTAKGKTPKRPTQRPAHDTSATLADLPTERQPAFFVAPDAYNEPPSRYVSGGKGFPDERMRGGYEYEEGEEDGDSQALTPGRPTILLPTLTEVQLPALRPEDEDRQLADYSEPEAPAVFIRGAAKAPRPYLHVVPRRAGRRSFVAQFIVAMITVMVLLTAATLTTPLGRSVAFARTFQSYANAVPWIPTPTPTPRPYIPPPGANPGQQAVINEIVAVFGSYAPGAINVARCESGFDPNARNPYPIGNSHAEGVFQILYPSTWDTTSYAASSPYGYVDNIHAAFQIFSRDGHSWREWECQP